MTSFSVEDGPHLSPSTMFTFDGRQLAHAHGVGEVENTVRKGETETTQASSANSRSSSVQPCVTSLASVSSATTGNEELLELYRELNDMARDLPWQQLESQQAANKEHGQTAAELQCEASMLRTEHQEACCKIVELDSKLNMLRFRADMEREAAAQESLELDLECKRLHSLLETERGEVARKSAEVELLRYQLTTYKSLHESSQNDDEEGKPGRYQPEMEHGADETMRESEPMVHGSEIAKSEMAIAEPTNAHARALRGSCDWVQQPDTGGNNSCPAGDMANWPVSSCRCGPRHATEANGESTWEIFIASFGCCRT